jgi:putative ABC transport system ATP-binding protein
MALVELQEVSKLYVTGDATLRALDRVSLQVEQGSFVAIMGASGSGKSTLMNVIGCLDVPTSGRYLLDGVDVARLTPDELAVLRNRTIGFVFQHFQLLSRTSARENVELPLVYADVTASERVRRASEALSRVGLGDRMEHVPSRLSGGQQQRVAIARALVNRPRLLVADEPTGNLDTSTSLEVMTLLEQLWRGGLTIVLVTHEADIAHHAERVVTMRDGRIVLDVGQVPISAAHGGTEPTVLRP